MIRNILLGRTVKVNDGKGKAISTDCVLKPFRLQHIKTLFLVTLKNIKRNMFTGCPTLILGDEGYYVPPLCARLSSDLTLWDNHVPREERSKKVDEPGER